MSLAAWFLKKGPTGFGFGSTAEEVSLGIDLTGKTYLVTGCNSGLGAEAFRVLILRGATVYGAARTLEKAQAECQKHGPRALPLACELSQPSSVRACAEALKSKNVQLDGILCNAGIMALPQLKTAQGYELQFYTNHIGHFILVNGLLSQLKPDARVIVLSSEAHRYAPKGGIDFENLRGEKSYVPWVAYGQSKMACLLFAKELARRFKGTDRLAIALHPGVISTALGRNMPRWQQVVFKLGQPIFLKTVEQGAATEVFAAIHPAAKSFSGEYLKDCNIATPRSEGLDPELAQKLWEVSEKIAAASP